MENKYRPRGKIISMSDSGQGPHLKTKEDMLISEAIDLSQKATQARANIFIDMENRIKEESCRKYPNEEYISRCRKIQEEHRRCYEEMLTKQKGE